MQRVESVYGNLQLRQRRSCVVARSTAKRLEAVGTNAGSQAFQLSQWGSVPGTDRKSIRTQQRKNCQRIHSGPAHRETDGAVGRSIRRRYSSLPPAAGAGPSGIFSEGVQENHGALCRTHPQRRNADRHQLCRNLPAVFSEGTHLSGCWWLDEYDQCDSAVCNCSTPGKGTCSPCKTDALCQFRGDAPGRFLRGTALGSWTEAVPELQPVVSDYQRVSYKIL